MLGADRQNRIGRKVHMKSVHVRVSLTAAATITNEDILLMLLVDKDVEGALPTSGGR